MSTQKAFFSYEEVIDLHTEHDRVSVIGVHTPTGDTPRRLCPGFFQQFKKYKYMGCKVALVPAATLPAEPASVSYGAGEAPIDMRDILNPILWHGCHGNDLGDILNRLYAANAVTGDSTTMHLGSDAIDMVSYLNGDLFDKWDSLDANITFMESLYYRALTDRTWKKANIQRGFRIAGLRPRVYSLASTMQISGVSSLDAIGQVPAPFEIEGDWSGSVDTDVVGQVEIDNPLSNANRFMTPKTIPLGWLDTRNVLTLRNPVTVQLQNNDIGLAPGVIDTMVSQGTVPVELPKIFMGVILLPPAYKQEFYFRMIVTHFFAFAGFRGVSMSNDMLENPNYHDWNENITSGIGDDPTPDPDPEPEPVVLTVSIKNNASASRTASVAYNIESNPDPFTVQKSIAAGATSLFDPQTVLTGDSVRITNVSSTASVDVEIDGTHGSAATLYVTLNSNGTVSTSWTA